MSSRPALVGLPCDHRVVGRHPFHMAGEKYIRAVRDGAGALPLLIPVLDPPIPPQDVIASLDGLMFTGSMSNVAPAHYGGPTHRAGVLEDAARDATALPLLRAAVAAGIPVLCICRGFQELNVALGGTLHQALHEVSGLSDHREDKDAPLDVQYGPAHSVEVRGGFLSELTPLKTFAVNSLHGQGIDKLASSLHADAVAADGVIEAVSFPHAKGFVLGVQWHPEWCFADDAVARAIFTAFGDAIKSYQMSR